jgi:hypothetical protein
MTWTRADALERWRTVSSEAAARLREGLDPDERIVAESYGVLVTSARVRTAGRPGDVWLDRVHAWHVRWSHDERPAVVLDHEPVIGPARSRSRTILWFHLGGDTRDVERTETALRFRGRRRPEFRATIALLASLEIPRTDDQRATLPGTRDQRLGASVSPALLVATTWSRRRRSLGSGVRRTRPRRFRRRRPSASDP